MAKVPDLVKKLEDQLKLQEVEFSKIIKAKDVQLDEHIYQVNDLITTLISKNKEISELKGDIDHEKAKNSPEEAKIEKPLPKIEFNKDLEAESDEYIQSLLDEA